MICNWRIPSPSGTFFLYTYSDQSLAPVVWLFSKVCRILWSSFESLNNVFLWKQRLWDSSQPQSLFSIIIRWGDFRLYIYTTVILNSTMCMLERARCTPGEGLAQVLGCHKTPTLVFLPLHYLQMYKNTKNFTAELFCIFPWWGNNFMGGLYEFILRKAFP